MDQPVKLTQFSHGSGCGCKIAPAVLETILKQASRDSYPGLLVGNESKDDAAVFRLADGSCLISTTDFFTPIVDDPFIFGRVAAANALSDVYAMGGKPLLAVAILGWPVDKLSAEVASMVMEGGRAACREVAIPLAGGHSIDSPEPFFGLAVNGIVREENILRNTGAREGDLLFLTKPVGTGILSSAMKRGKIMPEHERALIENLLSINKAGSALGEIKGVHAVTDVTGFGLLGHLLEMTEGSGVSAEIEYSKIPLLPGADVYASQFIFPDNTYRNWNAFEGKVMGVEGPAFITLCDPQTNGGLLIAAAPESIAQLKALFDTLKPAVQAIPVGKIIAKSTHEIFVKE